MLTATVCVVSVSCTSAVMRGRVSEVAPQSIVWHTWNAEAFAKARRENRLVFVDVGIEGCQACRWMHEDTYRNAEVVKRLREHFIAISVNADEQPEIGSRYESWAWPALIFLDSKGTQLLALRGNRRPKKFVRILDQFIRGDAARGPTQSNVAASTNESEWPDQTNACAEAVKKFQQMADHVHAGWGTIGERVVEDAPLRYGFFRAHVHRRESVAFALDTLERYADLVDSEWGGIFLGTAQHDWTQPIVEKRALLQARALLAFSDAYQIFHDARWVEKMESLNQYLQQWMRSPDGLYYNTQEDRAPSLPSTMSALDYYRLTDSGRREYGIPPIDHGIYVEPNSQIIVAYAHAFEAAGKPEFLQHARDAAEAVLRHADSRGWVPNAISQRPKDADDRMYPVRSEESRIYLKPQVEFGLAMLAMYRATHEEKWLAQAKQLAVVMEEKLRDRSEGGYDVSTRLSTDPMKPVKPFLENVQAARLFTELYFTTEDTQFFGAAQRSFAFLAKSSTWRHQGPTHIASYAFALESFLLGPIHFTLAGDAHDPRAEALMSAALRLYEPRKIVGYDKQRNYPVRGEPAMYLCSREACSVPITDPSHLESELGRLRTQSDSELCGP